MRFLITRPLEYAVSLKKRLEELGHQVIIDPLIRIVVLENISLPQDFGSIVTTSQQAIRCLANLTSKRDFPLWCVGSQSAKVAKELGFQVIHVADGNGFDLVDKLVATKNIDPNKPMIHLSGDVIRVDVVKTLFENNINAHRIIVYETREAEQLTAETQLALKHGNLDTILFYSPRTAHIFQKLCQASKLESHCAPITAACLSEAIKLEIQNLPWKNIQVAKKTTTDDLLFALMMAD